MRGKGPRGQRVKGSSEEPDIRAEQCEIAPDAEFGPDVVVRCRRLVVGAGVKVGVPGADGFRLPAGVRVDCDELVLGAGTSLGRSLLLAGGRLQFGPGSRVGHGGTFRVKDELVLGPACQFGPGNLVEGRRIRIGRELWTGPEVRIGGGSCFEVQSSLVAGYWLHLGMRVFVNTARPVTIGNEVGIGTGSSIFTHGAYQSALAGYPVSFAPVSIGDNCWLPGAVVNPGVSIGAGTVVGVGSVVNRSLPQGCLAAGVPCRVLKESVFPKSLSADEQRSFFRTFLADAAPMLAELTGSPAKSASDGLALEFGTSLVRFELDAARVVVEEGSRGATFFLLGERRVAGPAGRLSEKLRDLLRRHGIRFKTEVKDGAYQDWEEA